MLTFSKTCYPKRKQHDYLFVTIIPQYFGHFMRRVDSLEKTLMLEGLGAGGEGETEDEMAGWHHGLDGRESE